MPRMNLDSQELYCIPRIHHPWETSLLMIKSELLFSEIHGTNVFYLTESKAAPNAKFTKLNNTENKQQSI